MTTMDGEDLQRLWSLIDDLTNQLQANRQLCESLQQQADQLRGHALHSGTGFALRRFNTDVSKEQFETELEALNVHLVKEHLLITHENKQQAILLREYENTLETIMAKFRTFSHSTQQHTLRLTQHYETLLANTTHAAAEQTLAAETAFSGTLTHLGGLVRRAMQSLDGEDEAETHWSQDPRWYGSGGYTGKATDPASLRAERALEQLTEHEQLRLENETLRELLLLKDKSDALATSAAPVAESVRRASLTVDQASVAAEASGQPPLKALSISSTLKPGEQASPVSPTRTRRLSASAREKQEQIIEEAILADETDNTSSALADEDGEEHEARARGRRDSAPALDEATEDVDAIHAEFQPDTATTQPVVLTPPPAPALTSDDEPQPNLVAEAAPPALVSTGLPDATHTSVTSVSGPPESASPPTSPPSTTAVSPPLATEDAPEVIPAEPTSDDYSPVVPSPAPQPKLTQSPPPSIPTSTPDSS